MSSITSHSYLDKKRCGQKYDMRRVLWKKARKNTSKYWWCKGII